MPTFSIITPLHNKGGFINDTIGSVLKQTWSDWELIVVENGSHDDGPAQVETIALQEPRLQFFRAEKHGPGAARNFGLNRATGDWVLFLDADDLLEPNYLAEQLEAVALNHEADVVAGCWQEFAEGGSDEFTTRFPSCYLKDPDQVLDDAIGFAPWALHAAIIRREWLHGGRSWQEDRDSYPSEDTAFWFNVLSGAKLVWSKSRGALYRVNTPNSRNSPCALERWLDGVRGIVESNLQTIAREGQRPSSKQIETIMRVYESHYRRAKARGNLQVAKRALSDADYWLRRCSFSSISMTFRKLFGIKFSSFIAGFRES